MSKGKPKFASDDLEIESISDRVPVYTASDMIIAEFEAVQMIDQEPEDGWT